VGYPYLDKRLSEELEGLRNYFRDAARGAVTPEARAELAEGERDAENMVLAARELEEGQADATWLVDAFEGAVPTGKLRAAAESVIKGFLELRTELRQKGFKDEKKRLLVDMEPEDALYHVSGALEVLPSGCDPDDEIQGLVGFRECVKGFLAALRKTPVPFELEELLREHDLWEEM
jgi:hypothetical protein